MKHPADAKDLPVVSRPPGDAPVRSATDVLLIPQTYVEGAYENEQPAGSPAVPLADGLELRQLDHDMAELIFTSCTPRGHFFVPVRQFSARYAFVRQVDLESPEAARYSWDDEHLIFYSMVLSRVVTDNGHSLEFAARVVEYEDDSVQVVPTNPAAAATFRLRDDRDWLTQEEAHDLCALLGAFIPVKDELPERIVHALNVGEDVVYLQIVQRAVLLLGAALEGLINTSQDRVGLQFRERLPQIAGDVGIEGFSNDLAKELYEARSEAAHGSSVSMFRVNPVVDANQPAPPDAAPRQDEVWLTENEPTAWEKWAKAQDLLRAVVKKAILDPEFRDSFSSDEKIRNRWPVLDGERRL